MTAPGLPDLPDLYVLRHGETEWNRAGRMQGWLDSPLTEKGRAQARRQGRILDGLGAAEADVRVSPQGRAVATARLALPRRPEADLVPDDRLREIGLGRWQGLERSRIEAEAPAAFRGTGELGWYDRVPGGEGFERLEARCRAFLGALDRATVVVTHGITSRMLRLVALGRGAGDIESVPGGQGVVHAVLGGEAREFGEPP